MIITVKDELDLYKIAISGQTFRVKEMEDGYFRFIMNNHILYIKEIEPHHFDISAYCLGEESSEELNRTEWEGIWIPYFDLTRDYHSIRQSIPASDTFLSKAAAESEGLRILVQDPWEMLVTFIISQRKSIPAIKDAVERICAKWGTSIDTGKEVVNLFPSPVDMASATEKELTECKLGYRVSYIQNAIDLVLNRRLDLDSIAALSYEDLFLKLKEVRGVGDKVSNCICLFAYGKVEAAPVDTWIAKVIDNYYDGVNPFPGYKSEAGIMQQYIFYYAQTHKDEI